MILHDFSVLEDIPIRSPDHNISITSYTTAAFPCGVCTTDSTTWPHDCRASQDTLSVKRLCDSRTANRIGMSKFLYSLPRNVSRSDLVVRKSNNTLGIVFRYIIAHFGAP